MIEAIIRSLYMILPIIIIYAVLRKPKYLIVDLSLYEKIIDIDLQLYNVDPNVYEEWDVISYIENKKMNKIESEKYVDKFLTCFGTKKEFDTFRVKGE